MVTLHEPSIELDTKIELELPDVDDRPVTEELCSKE